MNIERLASGSIVLAALAISAAAVHREFAPNPASRLEADMRPRYVENWKSIEQAGVALDDTIPAKIRVLEFVDFECPICRRYDSTLVGLRKKYGPTLAVTLIHWPLKIHEFSQPAARAAECADRQGRFAQMKDALYAAQDSLGKVSWSKYAIQAGVPSVEEFERCFRQETSFPRIAAGEKIAEELQLTGTPTVIINGWRFRGGPSDSIMNETISDLLRNEKPRSAKSWLERLL